MRIELLTLQEFPLFIFLHSLNSALQLKHTCITAAHTHTHTCNQTDNHACSDTDSGTNTQRSSYSATFCQLLFAWATFVTGREKFSRSQIVCESVVVVVTAVVTATGQQFPTHCWHKRSETRINNKKPSRTLRTFSCPNASVKCNGQKVERISPA